MISDTGFLSVWIVDSADGEVPPGAVQGTQGVGRTGIGRERLAVLTGVSRAALLAMLSVLLVMPSQSAAQDQPQSVEDARRRLEADKRQLEDKQRRAGEIQTDVSQINKERERLNAQLVDTAKQVQASEAQMTAIEGRLGGLDEQEKLVRGSLEQRHGSIAKLLAAMQSMGRNPPPVMITKRDDALAMVRSAMLLASAFPSLRKDALALAEQLNDLVRVMTDIRNEGEKLKAETAKLADARTRTASLVEAKKLSLADRQEELSQIRRAAADISRNVGDLNDLISKLDQAVAERTALGAYERQIAAEQQRAVAAAPAPPAAVALKPTQVEALPPVAPSPAVQPPIQIVKAPDVKVPAAKVPDAKPAAELLPSGDRTAMASPGRIKPAVAFHLAKGRLSLPAQGRRVIAFGEKNQNGNASKGIVIETRASAQVTAPADGWVVYAGEFRSYGPLLIINAGGGYHLLLAGLAQIDVQLGQFVSAGEPVGLMAAAKASQGGKQGNAPVLYIEFKKDGQSIDPDPWWADGSRKVQG